MGFFASWVTALIERRFSAGSRLGPARALEAAGELERAAARYAELGAPREAQRVLVQLAERSGDPLERFDLLTRALGHAADPELDLRRGRLCIDLVQSRRLHLLPSELVELGRRFEALGQPLVAAEVYALAGDTEAEARALISAGNVDALESALQRAEHERRAAAAREQTLARARELVALGSRRAALQLLETLCTTTATPEAGAAAELRDELEHRRARGPLLRVEHDGVRRSVVFGERVSLGRAGTIAIAAPSLSREHLILQRTSAGIRVSDPGSRNGSAIGGARLAEPLELRGPVELILGGDVKVRLEPDAAGGGVDVSFAGERVHAPLGPYPASGFVLAQAADDWIELDRDSSSGLVLGGLRVDGPIELCAGDAIGSELGGAIRLRILE